MNIHVPYIEGCMYSLKVEAALVHLATVGRNLFGDNLGYRPLIFDPAAVG